MKRLLPIFFALSVVAGAGLSATVKQAQDPPATRRPAAAAATTPPEHQAVPAGPEQRGPSGESARDSGHGEEEAGHGLWSTIARLFNFALLVGSLVYLLRSPFAAYLSGRKVQIRSDLTTAAETRQAATAALAGIEGKLLALPGELKALAERGASEIAAEEGRIREAAEIERRRMLDAAKREIDRRAHLAERRLQRHAGELAVDLATTRVKAAITDSDRLRLVDRYLDQVGPERTR